MSRYNTVLTNEWRINRIVFLFLLAVTGFTFGTLLSALVRNDRECRVQWDCTKPDENGKCRFLYCRGRCPECPIDFPTATETTEVIYSTDTPEIEETLTPSQTLEPYPPTDTDTPTPKPTWTSIPYPAVTNTKVIYP